VRKLVLIGARAFGATVLLALPFSVKWSAEKLCGARVSPNIFLVLLLGSGLRKGQFRDCRQVPQGRVRHIVESLAIESRPE
jgi:hypothetical protein